ARAAVGRILGERALELAERAVEVARVVELDRARDRVDLLFRRVLLERLGRRRRRRVGRLLALGAADGAADGERGGDGERQASAAEQASHSLRWMLRDPTGSPVRFQTVSRAVRVRDPSSDVFVAFGFIVYGACVWDEMT